MPLNPYRIMWVVVMFDLPTTTKEHQRRAQLFREGLLKRSFTMMQYSVYMRHAMSREEMETQIEQVRKLMPPEGLVQIMHLTDKQFGMIRTFWGRQEQVARGDPQQLEMF